MKRTLEDYADIINLPYCKSKKHPHMSTYDRAAQFAPFAALTGHAAAINETARIVDTKMEIGEDAVSDIVNKLNYIQSKIKGKPTVIITYFVRDKLKEGGKYITQQTNVHKIDDLKQVIYLENSYVVSFEDIYEIIII